MAYSLVSIYCILIALNLVDNKYKVFIVNLVDNKYKVYKTLDYWSRDVLNFDFFRKGSGNSFSTTFCVSKFHVWLPLLLKILRNMCIVIVCFPRCDVTNFQINLILTLSNQALFLYDQKVKKKHFENKKNF